MTVDRQPARFRYDPDPDAPGWYLWGPIENAHFNTLYEPVRVLPLGPGRARVEVVPQRLLTSANGSLHGGAVAGFIDIALFAGAAGAGVTAPGGLTVDLSIQFLGAAAHGRPLAAEVEVLRETGRLLFIRGLLSQNEATIASFSATVRKIAEPA